MFISNKYLIIYIIYKFEVQTGIVINHESLIMNMCSSSVGHSLQLLELER